MVLVLVLLVATIFSLLTIGLDRKLHPETKLVYLPVRGKGTASALVTYIYAVIERAVLSNGDENRLVVRARVDAAHSVETSRQSRRDLGGQSVIRGGYVVETLEEREHLRVQRLSRLQRRN